MKMEEHLKSTYGFNKFRENQKEIITDLLNNENVFAILPTGGGKSLLYQFPATYSNKVTIVICPLISLMNDQCNYLNSKNIRSVCLNSENYVPVSEYKNYKVIYVTPEFVTSRINAFTQINHDIGLFAVDEAHSVSQWSHDFRESYKELGVIKETFPNIPILAVTATATPRVLDEMYEYLNVNEVCEYSLGTRRTNLAISVCQKTEFADCSFDEPTIVYVQTRKICEKLTKDLSDKGITTACYHGGMEKEEKERSHELFINGEVMVIVATISFGMGIDKSDIRHVVNYGVPSDIESYYQEIGRAGRDGVNSKATIYYNPQDFTTVAHLISNSSEESQKQIKTDAMKKFRSYLGENNLCRQQMIDYYFETGEFPTEDKITHIPKCNMCDNCCGTNKQEVRDLSEEAKVVVRVIKTNRNQTGFNLGMEKTIALIKKDNDPIFRRKTKKWIRDIIDILATKDIVERRSVGKYGALIIQIGKVNLNDSLPIIARIEEDKKVKEKCVRQGVKWRLDEDIWLLKNIDKDVTFIMKHFKRNRGSITSRIKHIRNEQHSAHKRLKSHYNYDMTKEITLSYYREGKTINEIAEMRQLSNGTIENHLLSILETEDIDIDTDYFGLTEEYENEIKQVVAHIGTQRIKPIKDAVNKRISYFQIKICLLIIRIEEEE
tara:strand:+ start:130 stop:2121 length:1992 start_codon:yes stop_codon:yes gene_type:complete